MNAHDPLFAEHARTRETVALTSTRVRLEMFTSNWRIEPDPRAKTYDAKFSGFAGDGSFLLHLTGQSAEVINAIMSLAQSSNGRLRLTVGREI